MNPIVSNATPLTYLTNTGRLPLLKALETNLISHQELHDALTDLARHGFRLREEVYLEALRKADTSPKGYI